MCVRAHAGVCVCVCMHAYCTRGFVFVVKSMRGACAPVGQECFQAAACKSFVSTPLEFTTAYVPAPRLFPDILSVCSGCYEYMKYNIYPEMSVIVMCVIHQLFFVSSQILYIDRHIYYIDSKNFNTSIYFYI